MAANLAMLQTSESTRHAGEAGAKRAFEALYRQSFKRSYNLAYRMTGNRADAEDITQDAYMSAWRNLDRFVFTGSFDAWIYRILTNLALNRIRYRRAHPFCSLSHATEDGTEFDAADSSTDPQRLMMSSVLDETLQTALLALPEEFRLAILLADVEERSYLEIADIMDCPLGTVRSRVHRARRMMRRAIQKAKIV